MDKTKRLETALTVAGLAFLFGMAALGIWLRLGFYGECRAQGFSKLYCAHVAAARP